MTLLKYQSKIRQKCKQTHLMHQIQGKIDNIGYTRTKSSSTKTFFRKIPVKQKGEEKHSFADTIEAKSTIQGSTEGKEVRWRRDLERTCSTGFWEGKYGIRKCRRDVKGSTLKEIFFLLSTFI